MNPSGPIAPAIRFTRISLGSAVLVLALLVTVCLYFRLHAALLNDPWPITMRESAFILQTEALLDPTAPPQYSEDSVPLNINLYGPLYPLFAAPFVAAITDEPYLAHRLATGLCLVLTSLLLAWSTAKHSGWLAGFAAGAIFYCATIGSPSPAAGPDTLAILFYVAAIVLVRHCGCGPTGLIGATMLGFGALMTKPYAVWIIPCLLVYVAWRQSILRGLLFGGSLLIAGLLWALLANHLWPEYFFSVFSVHAHAATRHFYRLREQVLEFSYLNFAPLLLLAVFTPWKRLWQTVGSWRWTKPETTENGGHFSLWPLYMCFAALAPLLISMGWHGGAHIIYFNHLWLPPLLLAAFDLVRQESPINRRVIAHWLTVGNVVLLIILLPPMPSAASELQLPPGEPILVDPVLEPLRRSGLNVDVVDNAQAEFWIYNAIDRGSPGQKSAALQWTLNINNKIKSAYYSTIILAAPATYERNVIWNSNSIAPEFANNYDMIGHYTLAPYYTAIRNRTAFGRYPVKLFVFTRKTPVRAGDTP